MGTAKSAPLADVAATSHHLVVEASRTGDQTRASIQEIVDTADLSAVSAGGACIDASIALQRTELADSTDAWVDELTDGACRGTGCGALLKVEGGGTGCA